MMMQSFLLRREEASLTTGGTVTPQRLVQLSPLLKVFWGPLGSTCLHCPFTLCINLMLNNTACCFFIFSEILVCLFCV